MVDLIQHVMHITYSSGKISCTVRTLALAQNFVIQFATYPKFSLAALLLIHCYCFCLYHHLIKTLSSCLTHCVFKPVHNLKTSVLNWTQVCLFHLKNQIAQKCIACSLRDIVYKLHTIFFATVIS